MTDKQALLLKSGQRVILTCWRPNPHLVGTVWLPTSLEWYEPERKMRPCIHIEVVDPPKDFENRLWQGIPDWVEFPPEQLALL